jgi:hypothetical protein
MSKSVKALKLISKSVPELRLCKDKLVVSPTEHIVRCFVFEWTPYKGLFYFWRVVLPLYTPMPVFYLSQGQRLAKGDYISLSDPEFASSIRNLTQIILDGELRYLQSIRRPEDFLERFGGEGRNEGYTPQIVGLEAALTYYLVGNIPLCIEILEEFASEDLNCGSADMQWAAGDLAREMRTDPLAAARKIRALEQANVERFGLAPSLQS